METEKYLNELKYAVKKSLEEAGVVVHRNMNDITDTFLDEEGNPFEVTVNFAAEAVHEDEDSVTTIEEDVVLLKTVIFRAHMRSNNYKNFSFYNLEKKSNVIRLECSVW